MILQNLVPFAELRDYGQHYVLYLGATDEPGGPVKWVAAPVTFKARGEHEEAGAPTLELRPADAQRLFDELWRVGLRPTQDPRDPSATVRHLEDMRALAFGKLGIEPPEAKAYVSGCPLD